MSKLKEANPKLLPDRYSRACAKLANMTRRDIIYGGTAALVLANRLARIKGSEIPAQQIVSDVYIASNYSCGKWGAYACPECGQACLGTAAAYACCAVATD